MMWIRWHAPSVTTITNFFEQGDQAWDSARQESVSAMMETSLNSMLRTGCREAHTNASRFTDQASRREATALHCPGVALNTSVAKTIWGRVATKFFATLTR